MPLADVNECYRRRRVHSAGEETRVLDEVWGDSLYLWAPGLMSLGDSEGSALLLYQAWSCGSTAAGDGMFSKEQTMNR